MNAYKSNTYGNENLEAILILVNKSKSKTIF